MKSRKKVKIIINHRAQNKRKQLWAAHTHTRPQGEMENGQKICVCVRTRACLNVRRKLLYHHHQQHQQARGRDWVCRAREPGFITVRAVTANGAVRTSVSLGPLQGEFDWVSYEYLGGRRRLSITGGKWKQGHWCSNFYSGKINIKCDKLCVTSFLYDFSR